MRRKIDPKSFKVRCSAIGQIMTEPRSKTEFLSKTCISYLEQWVKEQLYNRKKEISSKYFTKGIIMEEDAIDRAAEHLGLGMLLKNEKQYFNDFMTGEPDVIVPDMIIEMKNSWSVFTFPLLENELPAKDKDYYGQTQGYMKLARKKKAKIIYCLENTPFHLIERAARGYCYDNGHEMNDEILQRFQANMTYDDIDPKLRIKVFDIERDDAYIKRVEQRVIDCREHLKQMIKGL